VEVPKAALIGFPRVKSFRRFAQHALARRQPMPAR
jgi:hypothetical protein